MTIKTILNPDFPQAKCTYKLLEDGAVHIKAFFSTKPQTAQAEL